jgi:Rrf2 family cysteine metabolism transcriptional repressor
MIVSAKTEYACIAVLELAARSGTGEPVRIRDIAEAQGIPSRFLVQILLQLKSAGLVQSVRGASGGYQLAKEPAEITLGEVMAVVDGQSGAIRSNAGRCTPITRALVSTWQKVAATEREMLDGLTFADLIHDLRGQADAMYYI